MTGLFSGKALQSDNLSDELIARGLKTVTTVNHVYDAGGTLGGPIIRDRLWFYGSFREWGNDRGAAGKFYNATQGTPFYTEDPSRPAYTHEWMESKAIRVTWRASERHKFNFFVDPQRDCHCPANVASGSINAPESFFNYKLTPAGLYQVTWNMPATNRLLFEAGAGVVHGSWPTYRQPEVSVNDISILEQNTGVRYGSGTTYRFEQHVPRYSQRASMSYVTGSHAFKAGFQFEESLLDLGTEAGTTDLNYTFRNQIPVSVTQWATPFLEKDRNKDWGFFVQDQWTVSRMTLTGGLRYEYFHGYIPAQDVAAPPSGWVQARSFGPVENVPLWKDFAPRMGAAYDLFGNGRTALKFAVGRYVAKTGTAITTANNPINTSVNSVTRTWNDSFFGAGDPRTGNYVPDCNLGNLLANGECLDVNNLNFGALNVTTTYADDAIRGFDARGYNWDMTAEVQHELRPGVSLSAGYYRNWFGNFLATDNVLVSPADYDTYCITAPSDSRLPGGGGYQVCGLADISLAMFNRVTSVVTQAENFGKQETVNDFFNVTINARLGTQLQFGGGVDTGRSVNDACFDVDSPAAGGNLPGVSATPDPFTATTVNGQRLCRAVTPFKAQTQVKGYWSYQLPAEFVVSGAVQNISGPQVTATYTASNAEVAPGLGRNLAACGTRPTCTSTASNIPLIAPQTVFEDRYTRIDVRLAKRFQLTERVRVQANFNVYNVLNGSAVLQLNTTYGSSWLQPSLIEDGRMIQFSGSLIF